MNKQLFEGETISFRMKLAEAKNRVLKIIGQCSLKWGFLCKDNWSIQKEDMEFLKMLKYGGKCHSSDFKELLNKLHFRGLKGDK